MEGMGAWLINCAMSQSASTCRKANARFAFLKQTFPTNSLGMGQQPHALWLARYPSCLPQLVHRVATSLNTKRLSTSHLPVMPAARVRSLQNEERYVSCVDRGHEAVLRRAPQAVWDGDVTILVKARANNVRVATATIDWVLLAEQLITPGLGLLN